MGPNDSIMGFGLFTNKIQIDCGGIGGEYAMRWTVFLKIKKDVLLQ